MTRRKFEELELVTEPTLVLSKCRGDLALNRLLTAITLVPLVQFWKRPFTDDVFKIKSLFLTK